MRYERTVEAGWQPLSPANRAGVRGRRRRRRGYWAPTVTNGPLLSINAGSN